MGEKLADEEVICDSDEHPGKLRPSLAQQEGMAADADDLFRREEGPTEVSPESFGCVASLMIG